MSSEFLGDPIFEPRILWLPVSVANNDIGKVVSSDRSPSLNECWWSYSACIRVLYACVLITLLLLNSLAQCLLHCHYIWFHYLPFTASQVRCNAERTGRADTRYDETHIKVTRSFLLRMTQFCECGHVLRFKKPQIKMTIIDALDLTVMLAKIVELITQAKDLI